MASIIAWFKGLFASPVVADEDETILGIPLAFLHAQFTLRGVNVSLKLNEAVPLGTQAPTQFGGGHSSPPQSNRGKGFFVVQLEPRKAVTIGRNGVVGIAQAQDDAFRGVTNFVGKIMLGTSGTLTFTATALTSGLITRVIAPDGVVTTLRDGDSIHVAVGVVYRISVTNSEGEFLILITTQ